ncbi:MAG: tetratricopeptide repeat protein [Candidatus Cloacimonetes bacterium]|nr:tetratricopeptide repeat protein [Candidatus Cloacimonadota bacterium]
MLAPMAQHYNDTGFASIKHGNYKHALSLNPKLAIAYCVMAEAYIGQQQDETGQDYCQLALRLKPNLPEPHNLMGEICTRNQDFVAAIEHFKKAIELNPALAEAHANLGAAYVKTSQPELALEHCRRAFALDETIESACLNAGFACWLRDDREGLVKWFERAALRGNEYAQKTLEELVQED